MRTCLAEDQRAAETTSMLIAVRRYLDLKADEIWFAVKDSTYESKRVKT